MLKQNRNPSLLLSFFHAFDEIGEKKMVHKIVYVLEKKYNIPFTFPFSHTFYGVYSITLQYLIDIMKTVGLIVEENGVIKLTDKGKNYAMKAIEYNKKEYEIMKQLSLIEPHQYNTIVNEIKKQEKKNGGRETVSQ